MKKKKGGRPTVDTPEVRRKIEQAAAYDATFEEIAFFAGIHRDSLNEIFKKDPEFSDRVDALRNQPILQARETVVKSLKDSSNAQWHLERKRKAEFSTRSETDLTSGGKKIEVFNHDQVAKIARRILNGGVKGKGKSH